MSIKTLTMGICLVFHFGNDYICVSTVLLCAFRVLCLQNISFVEDHFHETWVRVSAATACVAISLGCGLLLVTKAEIKTGTVFSMLTRQAIPDGKT
jgi:hypothetical protein